MHDEELSRFPNLGSKVEKRRCYFRRFVLMLLFATGSTGFVATQANAAQLTGKALYERNCAVCHGADGEGAMPGVKDLVANPAWKNKSDVELTSVIVNGVQGPDNPVPMPPRAGNPDLTNEQIMSIVRYLRKLADNN